MHNISHYWKCSCIFYKKALYKYFLAIASKIKINFIKSLPSFLPILFLKPLGWVFVITVQNINFKVNSCNNPDHDRKII